MLLCLIAWLAAAPPIAAAPELTPDFWSWREDWFKRRHERLLRPDPVRELEAFFEAPFLDRLGRFEPLESRTEETDKEVIVKLSVPDLGKNSLNVRIEDSLIRVAYDARTVQSKRDAKGREYYRGQSVRRLESVMPVPENADASRARVVRERDTVKIIFPRQARADV